MSGGRTFAAIAVCLALGWAVGPADAAADDDWSFAIDTTYNSKYVWRGINVVDDHVFQPSVSASYRGLTASIWGNRDLTSENGQAGDWTEIDYGLDYSWAWRDLNLAVGGIYYEFPHSIGPSTTELYASVGLDTLLSPTLTWYEDIDEAGGAYVALSGGHTFESIWEPADGVTMDLEISGSVGGASSSYNQFYFGVSGAALSDAGLSVGAPLHLNENLTVTPAVNFSMLLDEEIRDSMSSTDNVWCGVSMTLEF